jgi:hypothetical protein
MLALNIDLASVMRAGIEDNGDADAVRGGSSGGTRWDDANGEGAGQALASNANVEGPRAIGGSKYLQDIQMVL